MRNDKKITTIIFDLMGVLLFKNADYIPNKLVDDIDAIIGQVEDDEKFRRSVCKKYHLSEKQFNLILDKIVAKYELFTPLWKILPKLRKEYKLAVINNGTSLTLSKFESKYHFTKQFDLFLSSGKEKIKKPRKKIYYLVLEKLKVLPENCLFMDDTLENVKAAKKIGMKTIYWRNREEGFNKFIKKMGRSQ